MRNICVAILTLCMMGGCSIPIRLIQVPVEDPAEVRREEWRCMEELQAKEHLYQEKIREENLHREKEGRKKEMYLIRVAIMKKNKIAQKEKEKAFFQNEHNILLKSFGDSALVLKAFERMGVNIFDIGVFLNEYGKNDFKGFCEFLQTRYPFSKRARWANDRDVFDIAERNYKLLKRLEGK